MPIGKPKTEQNYKNCNLNNLSILTLIVSKLFPELSCGIDKPKILKNWLAEKAVIFLNWPIKIIEKYQQPL